MQILARHVPKRATARLVPALLTSLLLLVTASQAQAHGGAAPSLNLNPGISECMMQFSPQLTLGQFQRFSRQIGLLSAYKQGAPATGIGAGNWNVGINFQSTGLDQFDGAWNNTFTHPESDHYLLPTEGLLKGTLSGPNLYARVGI
ncbi:MAG: hypothetical protein KC502_04900, partial [Myxococcales bacterium]|nr:hypothetical protein [Myxococcales bacterium]